jgi:hypothetical protein
MKYGLQVRQDDGTWQTTHTLIGSVLLFGTAKEAEEYAAVRFRAIPREWHREYRVSQEFEVGDRVRLRQHDRVGTVVRVGNSPQWPIGVSWDHTPLQLDGAYAANELMLIEPEHGPDLALTAQFLDDQAAWSRETFGPHPRVDGILAHLAKEIEETRANPSDLEEWVDLAILAWDGAQRQGFSGARFIQAYRAKAARNKERTWPDWRTRSEDQPIEHDRTEDRPTAKFADGDRVIDTRWPDSSTTVIQRVYRDFGWEYWLEGEGKSSFPEAFLRQGPKFLPGDWVRLTSAPEHESMQVSYWTYDRILNGYSYRFVGRKRLPVHESFLTAATPPIPGMHVPDGLIESAVEAAKDEEQP